MITRLINGSGNWEETKGPMPTMKLGTIESDILEIVIKYFHFKKKYDNVNSDFFNKDPPDFGQLHIPKDKLVAVLMAAHFLDC